MQSRTILVSMIEFSDHPLLLRIGGDIRKMIWHETEGMDLTMDRIKIELFAEEVSARTVTSVVLVMGVDHMIVSLRASGRKGWKGDAR